jgi:large subunit ribosomal protein L15
MSVTLSNLHPFPGSRKKTKRVGRGNASGKGNYSGRGQKGQRARSGGRKGLKLLGLRRILQNIPKKRGFKSLAKKPAIVNVETLNLFKPNTKITPQVLLKNHLVRSIKNGVKILGDGEIKVPLIIAKCQISKKAKEKIEKAGGKIEID